jgi:topoisomerase IA-like protein
MNWMNSFFSALGLGPSNAQLQKNKELAQSDLSGAVEMAEIGGKRRRRSKRKASKRKASKRKASKRKASKRSKASKRK